MHVLEVLEILAQDEQMEHAFVQQREPANRRAVTRIANRESKAAGLTGAKRAWLDVEVDKIRLIIGRCDWYERHAAQPAAITSPAALVRMHRTPVRWRDVAREISLLGGDARGERRKQQSDGNDASEGA